MKVFGFGNKILKLILTILIGVFLSILCLEVFLQTTSFLLSKYVEYKSSKSENTKINNNKDTITVLCVGESTTYHQWPIQLQNYLDNNSNKNFNVITVALPSIEIKN